MKQKKLDVNLSFFHVEKLEWSRWNPHDPHPHDPHHPTEFWVNNHRMPQKSKVTKLAFLIAVTPAEIPSALCYQVMGEQRTCRNVCIINHSINQVIL